MSAISPDLERKISLAFGQDELIKDQALDLANSAQPRVHSFLSNVTTYIINLKRQPPPQATEEPSAKRRKLAATSDSLKTGTSETLLSMTDVSFTTPLRKKLPLHILGAGIRAASSASGTDDIELPWSSLEQVIAVPVPEKAQAASYFVLIPRDASAETVVFTVPSVPPKAGLAGVTRHASISAGDGEAHDAIIRRTLDAALKPLRRKVVAPTPKEFVSKIVQAHRKGEKASHVKAWRGSKEGYLYFLETGILFGFKKPVVHLAFSSIKEVWYSSVLQRTFNLNVKLATPGPEGEGDGDEEEDVEFGMLDQADFAGIDAYVKGHGLHDASLAETRMAKRYNVNGPATGGEMEGVEDVKRELGGGDFEEGGEGGEGGGDDGGEEEKEEEEEGALAKAERELQDAEDAQEEDYDPSGGESEGSGSGSGSGSEEGDGYAEGHGEAEAEGEDEGEAEEEEEEGGYEDEDEDEEVGGEGDVADAVEQKQKLKQKQNGRTNGMTSQPLVTSVPKRTGMGWG